MSAIFGSQWFIKLLIVAILLIATYFIMKPVKSAQHLAMRRLSMMIFIAFAVIAALFPALLSRVAVFLGIGRGTDLLLYGLTLAFFSTLVTAYRRDAAVERKLTQLARTIALTTVRDGEPKPEKSTEAED
ncbi:DUF2304 domain-containing protein [Actinomyces sp.]|uniref:DUF2304 domain-containing protein n=1 Tax=Actinomyces sp. TaxID=29317 RepID=UPI00290B4FDE|nr:DUF2304 domain-containing protein [Actinomyces sp.]MDU5230780.1 DUF2304 domain-containing protein [Actinomyces sp.]MDU6756213.1 DUF2304 domain-containing protein [Actinomyces sp.]